MQTSITIFDFQLKEMLESDFAELSDYRLT